MPPATSLSDDALPLPAPEAPGSAADAVFETLLADIVSGVHPAGARLPAERDLARQLGASRPTLREALRRLAEWQLVAARRGSGIVVRDQREWMIEVLPAYLRYGTPQRGQVGITQIIADLLHLRRTLMLSAVELVAARVPAGGTDEARALLRQAWALREGGALFARADLAVLRSVVEVAGYLPSVWTINRMAALYADLARSLGPALAPPDDYVARYEEVLDALDRRDGDRAAQLLRDYLGRHDQRILAALEMLP